MTLTKKEKCCNKCATSIANYTLGYPIQYCSNVRCECHSTSTETSNTAVGSFNHETSIPETKKPSPEETAVVKDWPKGVGIDLKPVPPTKRKWEAAFQLGQDAERARIATAVEKLKVTKWDGLAETEISYNLAIRDALRIITNQKEQ